MKGKSVWKEIRTSEGILLYEGYTRSNKPYGIGRTFYPDRTVYQEGVFDIKGLVYGREYYPSGKVRFEGTYEINCGYGPNYPVYGKCYNKSGKKILDGKLSVWKSSLGYPMVKEPENYGAVIMEGKPDIEYFMWENLDRKEKNRYDR